MPMVTEVSLFQVAEVPAPLEMYTEALVEIKPKSSREEAKFAYCYRLHHPLMIVLILNSPKIVIAQIGSSAQRAVWESKHH